MAATHDRGLLVLEDGSVFRGRSLGASVASVGEVVFCTAMTGYQEALTDPSYTGQILTLTAAHVGTYGICSEDIESSRPQVAGFIVHECTLEPSGARAEQTLPDWLAQAGVPMLDQIDTRALVRRIRSQGAMRGLIAVGEASEARVAQLLEQVQASTSMAGQDLASEAGSQASGTFSEPAQVWGPPVGPAEPLCRVLAIDCGAKSSIYRYLRSRGCEVRMVPPTVSAQEIIDANPDGLFVSNGPGDPAAVAGLIETLGVVAGRVPTFGICLGHQLLALALGGTTWKLPFGHRGANQPVRDLETGQVEITSQNHGFCVDEASLEAAGCVVTHRHLNDQTVAGFRHAQKPISGVQFHPEASPGPHDAVHLFDRFVTAMKAAMRPPEALAGGAKAD
ncbi:MAG: glutamine-hydrolyzing carbamoyl-phosphate synthase small subunit [Phycisphaerales bacterium]|nr:glutamine-hydrolyzing carbamoyl-phosphate synthase small subunit [Phycisphaerales bacterium]